MNLRRRYSFVVRVMILLMGILYALNSYSQIKKVGIPLVINYEKSKYNAGTQSWCIAQQTNGMLYFANNQGVLQFDGTFWNLYPMPNGSVARAVAVDSLDNVYVGASDEFGVLKPNEYGVLSYYSLSKLLPEKTLNFDEIWKIHSTKEGIYFQSYSAQ